MYNKQKGIDMIYEYTGATLKFTTGHHIFTLEVKQAKGYYKHKSEYVVFINQKTDMSDLGEKDFECTYKCVCLNSPTEHSALHYAGKKYIKNWNSKHRIGKDYPLIHQLTY